MADTPGEPRSLGAVAIHLAVLTAPRPSPRHEGGTFKVERSSPDKHRREKFRLRLLEFDLELHWGVVKGADKTATHQSDYVAAIWMAIKF